MVMAMVWWYDGGVGGVDDGDSAPTERTMDKISESDNYYYLPSHRNKSGTRERRVAEQSEWRRRTNNMRSAAIIYICGKATLCKCFWHAMEQSVMSTNIHSFSALKWHLRIRYMCVYEWTFFESIERQTEREKVVFFCFKLSENGSNSSWNKSIVGN